VNEIELARSIAGMQANWSSFQAAIDNFKRFCLMNNWEAMEESRQSAISNLEVFLDEFSAVHRFLQINQNGK
jgi:hypothetical protein